jgi:uncharacterized protein YndB with AHSA1/START domain
MTPDRIERETVIAAPVERVWELLTGAEHIGAWFGDAGAEIDLRPGGAMVIRWAEQDTVHARVERVERHRVFAYRWAQEMGTAEFGERSSTLVEFTLTPEEDGTRLRVVESGFAALDASEEERARKFADNTGGWSQKLRELEEYAGAGVAPR